MIHDIYFRFKHAVTKLTFYHNKNYFDCMQNHKSSFHHKKKIATHAFDARITTLFYHLLSSSMHAAQSSKVDNYIQKLSHTIFNNKIEEIHQYIFSAVEQSSDKFKSINYEFSAHAKFLQQMKIYKTFKYAVKHADVDLIKQMLTQCCLLFHESDKFKYIFLSFYMI